MFPGFKFRLDSNFYFLGEWFILQIMEEGFCISYVIRIFNLLILLNFCHIYRCKDGALSKVDAICIVLAISKVVYLCMLLHIANIKIYTCICIHIFSYFCQI